jgi:hypothetical protein
MALAVDATSSITYNADHTTVNISHTCTGPNLLLIVGISVNYVAVTSATYNGVSMSLITSAASGSAKVAIFGLINPAAGTHNITFTVDSTEIGAAGGISFTGADQTTGWHNANTATGTTKYPTVVISSATDEYVVDAMSSRSWGTASAGAGQTAYFSYTGKPHAGSREVGATSTTMSWTVGDSGDTWAIAGVSVMAATAAAAGQSMYLGDNKLGHSGLGTRGLS